jgi:hypothetical protein
VQFVAKKMAFKARDTKEAAVKAAAQKVIRTKTTTRKAAAPRASARLPRSQHYSVYVVELSDEVWNIARFRAANPDYQLGKPYVYVGMTGLDPDVRFDKHKAGVQSNVYVRKFGLHLLPALYRMYNPMPYEGARDMEVELGIALREVGYGVWQA